jgi:hypothetical protein
MWTIAEIEKSITVVSITHTLKDRKEIARAFIPNCALIHKLALLC